MKKDSKRDTRCIMQSTKESKGKEKQKHQQSSMTSLPSVGRMHGGYNAACLALALRLAGRKSSFVFRNRNRLLLLFLYLGFHLNLNVLCTATNNNNNNSKLTMSRVFWLSRSLEDAKEHSYIDANLLERNYKFLFNRFWSRDIRRNGLQHTDEMFIKWWYTITGKLPSGEISPVVRTKKKKS